MNWKKLLITVCFFILFVFSGSALSEEDGGYLVKFRETPPDTVSLEGYTAINEEIGLYHTDSPERTRGLEQYIEYVEKNEPAELIEGEAPPRLRTAAQDEFYTEQWQLQMIKGEYPWSYGAYGNDVRVAVIDTGCYVHEDLKDNLLPGWNYLDDNADTEDKQGHGTHVSGIIGAQANDIGIVGTASKARIVPLKCFDPGVKTYADTLVKAIYGAVDQFDCQVINMSWTLQSSSQTLAEAVRYAYEKGAILVAAAGNYGGTSLCYPAAYEEVIGVGSVGKEKQKSTFSQYNKSVFVTAPGEAVKSTYLDGGYYELKGTSQAAPAVAGLAAAALSFDPSLSPERYMDILRETSEDLGDPGYDTSYGYGLVDGEKIIEALMEPMEYYVSPINASEDTAQVLIYNHSQEPLNAVSIFAVYGEGNILRDMTVQEVILQPDETVIRETPRTAGEHMAHFLWASWESLRPLAEKRELPAE